MRINPNPESSTTAAARVLWCVLVSLFSALLMVCLPT